MKKAISSCRFNWAFLTFHSLRHSAVTFLKAAEVSDVMAREIIGDESSKVSRNYTHLSVDDMRNAIQKIEDVTKDPRPV